MVNGMNDIISMSTMLQDFKTLLDGEDGKILSTWRKVVSRIKTFDNRQQSAESDYDDEEHELSLGERLAQNTHVVDLKKGVLLVEANHSGWIQYLRMYQKFILKGLQMECPEMQIKTLAFRTRGSDVSLHDGYEEELEKSLKKRREQLAAEEKEIKEFFEKNEEEKSDSNPVKKEKTEDSQINPEFKAKIDSLYETFRQTMLTNSEK